MAGGPVVLMALTPMRIVMRPEPGNWRVEQNGRLQGSMATEGQARAFAYAAAQFEYEFNGIVPHIFCVVNGMERREAWAPDHDFLDIIED